MYERGGFVTGGGTLEIKKGVASHSLYSICDFTLYFLKYTAGSVVNQGTLLESILQSSSIHNVYLFVHTTGSILTGVFYPWLILLL